MRFKNFQSPHVHLQSLDTGSTIKTFVKREKELETGSVTITDHGTLQGCMETYKLAKEAGLNPILGIEAYHRDDNCEILTNAGIEKNAKGTFADFYKYGHITLHAQDQLAYEALVKAVSKADLRAEQHGSERKPLFTWADLENLGSHNLTMTSGCLIGVVSRHIMADRQDLAVKYYEKVRSFAKPGNFYVEVFPHRCDKNWVSGVFITLEDDSVLKFYSGKKVKTSRYEEITVADLAKAFTRGDVGKLLAIKNRNTWNDVEQVQAIKNCVFVQDFIQNECQPWCPDGDVQLGANKILMGLAAKYGDKIIISDDSHYAYADDKIVQDARLGGMGDSFRFYGHYHRQTSDEAFEYFKTYLNFSEKQFEEMLAHNQEWADKFKNFKLDYKPQLPTSFYPTDTLAHLYKLIENHGRMNWNDPKRVARLESEINLLHRNGYIDWLPYFFMAEEGIEEYAKRDIITGPGRGSAAGLYINYLLEVTHLDPLDWNLSQDRFLTQDRIANGKNPDIDMDFPDRTIILQWLADRFPGHYAQISTDQSLRIKSGIKDVARFTYGWVPEDIMELAESLPIPPQGIKDIDFINGYKTDDGSYTPGVISYHKGLQEYIKKYPEQWEIVQKFLGLQRSKSRHACLPFRELIFSLDEDKLKLKEIGQCDNQVVMTGSGKLAPAKLIAQGKRMVKKYKLSNQLTIYCTPDHKIMTELGWMEIEEAFLKRIKIINILPAIVTK